MKVSLKILVLFLFIISCDDHTESGVNNFEFSDSSINGLVSSKQSLNDVVVTGKAGTTKIKKDIVERKLIKNGNIAFETENLEETKANILGLVKKYDGYVASDSQNNYGNRKSININVRIPAQHFDSILSGISKNVSKFDTKNIRISDVTEEFLDIESRLKNKKELENKYLDILKKANTVQDILNVERELGKLREDIEATEGRLKYLQNQVAFSTLTINFYKVSEHSSTFGNRISDGFANGFENLKGFFIGLINVWPFILILSIIIFLIRKRFKKKKK